VIDLNDVWQPPVRFDLAAVRDRLAATASDWLPALFPEARASPDRKTLRCADLSGRPPRNEGSCVIHLQGPRAGWGYDHATGESAGPIDLIHHATGLSGSALFEEAARLARLDAPTPSPTDGAAEVGPRPRGGPHPRWLPADRRYRGGGLSPEPRSDRSGLAGPSLFHPDLTDYEARRGWSGMVAVVHDGAGAPTGGIHRTFLLDDGSAKAPPGKKMLDAVGGGSVRLAPVRDDGHLGIAEGIETALSAQAIFGVPTWAALSADGLRRWQWPAGLNRVTIFADAG
jgi:putative DNA primase/helicase